MKYVSWPWKMKSWGNVSLLIFLGQIMKTSLIDKHNMSKSVILFCLFLNTNLKS
jgi:hypothetical protein